MAPRWQRHAEPDGGEPRRRSWRPRRCRRWVTESTRCGGPARGSWTSNALRSHGGDDRVCRPRSEHSSAGSTSTATIDAAPHRRRRPARCRRRRARGGSLRGPALAPGPGVVHDDRRGPRRRVPRRVLHAVVRAVDAVDDDDAATARARERPAVDARRPSRTSSSGNHSAAGSRSYAHSAVRRRCGVVRGQRGDAASPPAGRARAECRARDARGETRSRACSASRAIPCCGGFSSSARSASALGLAAWMSVSPVSRRRTPRGARWDARIRWPDWRSAPAWERRRDPAPATGRQPPVTIMTGLGVERRRRCSCGAHMVRLWLRSRLLVSASRKLLVGDRRVGAPTPYPRHSAAVRAVRIRACIFGRGRYRWAGRSEFSARASASARLRSLPPQPVDRARYCRRARLPRSHAPAHVVQGAGVDVAAMIWSRTDWSGSGGGSSVGSSRMRSNACSMNGPSITGLWHARDRRDVEVLHAVDVAAVLRRVDHRQPRAHRAEREQRTCRSPRTPASRSAMPIVGSGSGVANVSTAQYTPVVGSNSPRVVGESNTGGRSACSVRSPTSSDSPSMTHRQRSSGKSKQFVWRSTIAQLHTSCRVRARASSPRRGCRCGRRRRATGRSSARPRARRARTRPRSHCSRFAGVPVSTITGSSPRITIELR